MRKIFFIFLTFFVNNLYSQQYGIINLSVANLRSRPTHAAELTTQALLGMPVKVLKKESYWYYVQTPDEYKGWTDEEAVTIFDSKSYNEFLATKKLIFLEFFGFCYQTPNQNSQTISDLVLGNVFNYIGEEGNFYKIQFPDKRIGFVEKKFCEDFEKYLDKQTFESEKIVSWSKKFLGFPYLWGGTSGKGVDCSGFVQLIYFLNGLIITRDADQQFFNGFAVDAKKDFSKLEAGDLLFFFDKNKKRIQHVGIYLGNEEFIHAAGKVKINSLDKNKPNFNGFRLQTFAKATRIRNSVGKNGVIFIKEHSEYKKMFKK